MSKLTELEIKIKPKFVVDEDTAYQCLALLEMYCNAENRVVDCFKTSPLDKEEWKINLEFADEETISKRAYKKGFEDCQEFVEKKCKELGIDYINIFTCESKE